MFPEHSARDGGGGNRERGGNNGSGERERNIYCKESKGTQRDMRCPSSSIPPCIFSQLSLFDSLKSSSLSSENITCLFKFIFVHSPQFVPGHHDLICPLSPFSVLHSVRILLPSKTPVELNQPLHQTGLAMIAAMWTREAQCPVG